MSQHVFSFANVDNSVLASAGGKGGMLVKMYQSGFPVPEGLIVLSSAFQEEKLNKAVWPEIQAHLHTMRKKYTEALFAVRSSALSEDSVQASFAGEFETVLNVKTDEEVLEAVYTVFRSKESERVKAYSSVQGMEQSHQIAVVIQLMIQSEISGVLFTADPITGSFTNMTGNFVYGLGEQLVSGETNAYTFKFIRPKGTYDGPDVFKKYALQLYQFAARLENELAGPQDIEWAVANRKLYILQTRPITTLKPGNPATYEWNDSLSGDFLWVNTNIGEAIPDVMTPLTWTIIRAIDAEQSILPGFYLLSGNICGRAYTNISLRFSVLPAFGIAVSRVVKMNREVFGQLPDGMNIPIYPYSRLGLLKVMIPKLIRFLKNFIKSSRKMQQYLKNTPDWCRRTTALFRQVKTKEQLLSLYKADLQPYTLKAFWMLMAGGTQTVIAMRLKEELTMLVGTEDANALLSNLRGSSELASLGPIVGIAKIIKGEMSREEYLLQYGHRGPHEFELSIPHPAENADWLEKQIAEFIKSDTDVEELLNKQYMQYEAAWKRFQQRFPNKVKWLEKQIAKAAAAARLRETVRSEFIRVFRVNRTFAQKAGELAGIGPEDGVFFLYLTEVLDLLSGKDSAVKHIPARKETYNKYKTLPPYPSIIRGRFNPFQWVGDPNRRSDYYDAAMPYTIPDSETLKGFAGAAGRVEGSVRILTSPEDGDKLHPGEILVASTTNIGWTPLFPRASAIITDIGAPLSHAAIVARELGIPAVVGCGNATARLKTGDRVIVDGGQGVVHILSVE